MSTHWKLGAATLVATLVLGLAAGGATAGKLSVNDRDLKLVWRSSFEIPTGFGALLQCPLTLSGSFHSSTTNKVTFALIGQITGAQLDSAACTGEGSASVLAGSLPWHVTYHDFSGTLPFITTVRVNLIGLSLAVDIVLGFQCLFRTTTVEPARLALARDMRGTVTAATIDPTRQIDSTDTTSIFCDDYEGVGLNWTLGGTGAVETGGGALTMNLI